MRSQVRASLIVVGFGAETYLEECLRAADHACSPEDEIVVVNNGIHHLDRRRPRWPSRVTLVQSGGNKGFAAGVNLGVRRSTGRVLVLLNSDVTLCSDAVEWIVEAAQGCGQVIAAGSLRIAQHPDQMNSAGNPVHYTGLCWAGGNGTPAHLHDREACVATPSGAFLAVSRDGWTQIGEFNESYFMYHEDVEWGLRAWLSGWEVHYVPKAVAFHHYEFSRNRMKMYLLERNRIITVSTLYPKRALLALAPAFLLLEIAVSLVALRKGWYRDKLQGYLWLWRNRSMLMQRRRDVRSGFDSKDDARMINMLTPKFDLSEVEERFIGRLANRLSLTYWQFAMRGVGARVR